MDTQGLIEPVSRLMATKAVARNWGGLGSAVRYVQCQTREKAFQSRTLEGQSSYALTSLRLDWVIAGAGLLRAEKRPGNFSNDPAIGERLQQADHRGLLINRFSFYSHLLSASEVGIPMTAELQDIYHFNTERLREVWSDALSEVGGDRSRLPTAGQLIAAVRKVNSVVPSRVSKIIESTVNPTDIRL